MRITPKKKRNSIVEDKEIEEKKLSDNRGITNDLKVREGSLKSEIKSFNKIENSFNSRFNESFIRNISGFYFDEDLIKFEKTIIESKLYLEKQKKELGEQSLKVKEQLKSSKSERIKNIELKFKVNNSLDNKKIKLKELDNEIEKRKEIIKYIEFTEDKIFNTEEIISTFDKKINLLKEK